MSYIFNIAHNFVAGKLNFLTVTMSLVHFHIKIKLSRVNWDHDLTASYYTLRSYEYSCGESSSGTCDVYNTHRFVLQYYVHVHVHVYVHVPTLKTSPGDYSVSLSLPFSFSLSLFTLSTSAANTRQRKAIIFCVIETILDFFLPPTNKLLFKKKGIFYTLNSKLIYIF